MADTLDNVRELYGSFFDGLTLAAVETVYWPVHRFGLTVHLRQSAELDALEEGLLRFVDSGLTSPEDISRLLGCSPTYIDTMGKYLGAGVTPYVSASPLGWSPTSATRSAVASRERTILASEERDLLRDGLFGFWISHGDTRFKLIDNPTQEMSPSRLLGTLKTPNIDTSELSDVCRSALSTFDADVEIHSYEPPKATGLVWVALRLLLFQSDDKKAGRVLLLNPEQGDQPLDDLSFQFEQLLRKGSIPTYFSDDSLGTGASFWTSLRMPLMGFEIREHLSVIENELCETRNELQSVKTQNDEAAKAVACSTRFSQNVELARSTPSGEALIAALDALTDLVQGLAKRAAIDAHHGDLPQTIELLKNARVIAPDQYERLLEITQIVDSGISAQGLSDSDRKVTADRAVALLQLMATELRLTTFETTGTTANDEIIRRYEEAIANRDAERRRLLDKISEMPTTELIESREHPPLLKRAIKDAQSSLIIISPWIKMRVLRPLLPDLDDLLGRGCEVWVGYGMPKSRHHQDTSDPDAIKVLQERQQTGRLHLIELTTHEKVLIVDDSMFVNSSFNWLSYAGTDGRRETGTVLKGRVSHLRDRFLSEMQKKAEAATRGAP